MCLIIFLIFCFPAIASASSEFNWPTQIGRISLYHNIDPQLFIAIAECESGFDSLALNYNYNKKTGATTTSDIGLMQINSTHWKFFRKIGLDVVHNPIDNLEAAAWLLEHNGTSDYKASEHCWSKKINNYGRFDAIGSSTLPLFLALK